MSGEFALASQIIWDGLILHTFGNIWIFGAVAIIFFLLLEHKLGLSSDAMGATVALVLISIGGATMPYDFVTGVIGIIGGILLGIGVWRAFRG